ncbi:ABC transporter ATP-binding protein [Vibrio sp.]|nr:ABC transporter ATP-binding protein [Vibrio sp.]
MTNSNIDTNTLVSLRSLKKEYGHFTAVNSIDLEIKKGEFLTFLGSSGSGKSTTLSMIAGFETPSSGEILLSEKSLIRVPSHQRGIGMVFQNYSLFPHMSVRDNIGFPLDIRHFSKEEKREKVENALRLVQLESFADRRPSELSGGQKQRVAIARALIYEPDILLMDEPLGALDKKLREDLQDELRLLHRRLGITIIYVTHDQDEAMRLSERIAIFKEGEIVGLGSGKDLYRNPPNAFVASFLGNSNFINITIGRNNTAHCLGSNILLPENHGFQYNSDALLMIRPEDIRLLSKEDEKDLCTSDNLLYGTIEETVFLGESVTCSLILEDGTRIVSKCMANDIDTLQAGNTIALTWQTDYSSVFEHDSVSSGFIKSSIAA